MKKIKWKAKWKRRKSSLDVFFGEITYVYRTKNFTVGNVTQLVKPFVWHEGIMTDHAAHEDIIGWEATFRQLMFVPNMVVIKDYICRIFPHRYQAKRWVELMYEQARPEYEEEQAKNKKLPPSLPG